jgi:hypothetical protein
MKKVIFTILGTAFILGAGTAVFAAGSEDGILGFEKMKPFMQQMHPDFSDKQLEDMYQTCHGSDGGQVSGTQANMMNRF